MLNNASWKNLRKLLLEIVKDCRVSFVPTEISELKVEKYPDGRFEYKFTLINNKQKPIIKIGV